VWSIRGRCRSSAAVIGWAEAWEGTTAWVPGPGIAFHSELIAEMLGHALAAPAAHTLHVQFRQLETVLAEHLGLERTERRLLAVMYEQTRPRLGIRARLYLDMTDGAEFEAAMARLCAQLRQHPDQ
jgi:hypothetical protein